MWRTRAAEGKVRMGAESAPITRSPMGGDVLQLDEGHEGPLVQYSQVLLRSVLRRHYPMQERYSRNTANIAPRCDRTLRRESKSTIHEPQ